MGRFTDIHCDDFHRLKFSTLPLVYDDSLSYLEMIARLTARIDHIVEEVADAMEIGYEYDQNTCNMELSIGLSREYLERRHEPYRHCI